MSADLAHIYHYPFASHLEDGYGLRLATSGTREDEGRSPYFFEGRLRRADELADMLLVLSEVVTSRFYLPGAMRQLDPVVTCSEDALRFEGFSSCCGVYGRADFSGGAFESGLIGRGTTNVDFNAPMRGALGRLRRGGEARLSVGAEEVKISSDSGSAVEKKVKLPVRWIKGFTEVQAYFPRLEQRLEISGSEARKFLRDLPRGGAPKRPAFVVPSGRGVRLTQRSSSDGIRVLGTDRLRLIEPIAARASSLLGWVDDETGVSAWQLVFETGWFWLAISPDISRGFSGEGQVLEQLTSDWESSINAVRAQLHWQSVLRPEEVAEVTGLDRESVTAALAALSTRGLVGYDPRTSAYFHRELPFALSKVEMLQPRLRAARKLIENSGVRWKRRSATDGEAMVQGSGVEHRVRLSEDEDRCTCRWFSRNQGDRGPCKHILACRLDLGETE